jgi:hypothetical protein
MTPPLHSKFCLLWWMCANMPVDYYYYFLLISGWNWNFEALSEWRGEGTCWRFELQRTFSCLFLFYAVDIWNFFAWLSFLINFKKVSNLSLGYVGNGIGNSMAWILQGQNAPLPIKCWKLYWTLKGSYWKWYVPLNLKFEASWLR